MNKNFDNNGFKYVDLDLPSHTLWATCNVGATKPTEYGLYFQWGDIRGYKVNQIKSGLKKFAYDWSDYKWGVSPNFKKYNTIGATLELEDDAANINMNGDWHIPSPSQIKELLDNTISAWATLNGANGRLFISKKDFTKSIFIPASGYACDGSVKYSGVICRICSSMLGTNYAGTVQSLGFSSEGAYLCVEDRFCSDGFSVRGVIG